ncbi:MAG: hypothetical protein RLZZ306_3069 [Bacteroidota bacterium]|jgi:hypothetical protein
MKIAIIILKGVIILLFTLDLLFWTSLHASGHKIPKDTDKSLAIYALSLLAIFILLLFWSRKLNK